MAPKFGFWHFKGQGQKIRNLLHYVGENYEEKQYEFGPAPDLDRSDWLNEKFSHGLKYPNIPYYIDGDVKLTQSLAILRHLARKYDLTVRNESEQVQVDILEQQLVDGKWVALFIPHVPPENVNKLKEYDERLPLILKPFSDILESNTWILGDRITYLDFMVYDLLEINIAWKKNSIDAFPSLKGFMTRFEALPNIKKYFSTADFKTMPTYPPKAYYENNRLT